MSKARVSYLCRECGGVQAQWMGKCPDCGTWDALEKYIEPKLAVSTTQGHPSAVESQWITEVGSKGHSCRIPTAIPLPDVETSDAIRKPTGISEFDRVLGGGLVEGSVVLLGGDPGIGKSTLLLQAAAKMVGGNHTVLYVSSEESAYQTRLRAERIVFSNPNGDNCANNAQNVKKSGLDKLFILADTNLARIIEQAKSIRPAVMIVDSIQMIYNSDVDASPGSITQLRRCCMDLVYLAKLSGISIVLVGHVTKQGQIAGPKLIEHLVDTVLSFEGDKHHAHRIVRAMKNRFGTTLEVALFEMTGSGLCELEDGLLVIDEEGTKRAGSVVCPAMHGSRCLPVEIQALTATGFLGNARRKASGLDSNRLAMLIAVLEKHGGLRLADQDVFVSTTGGLKVIEPAGDLALCLAIAGAHLNRSLQLSTAVVGEVGLGGEVRRINAIEQRMREAARLGYRTLLVPPRTKVQIDSDIELVEVQTIAQGIEQMQSMVSNH